MMALGLGRAALQVLMGFRRMWGDWWFSSCEQEFKMLGLCFCVQLI